MTLLITETSLDGYVILSIEKFWKKPCKNINAKVTLYEYIQAKVRIATTSISPNLDP
jgi:hypothetical protein